MRAALCCLVLLASSCGALAELKVTVNFLGVDAPAALKVLVQRESDPNPQVVGPVTPSGIASEDRFIAVEFGERFFVDVWGCTSVLECDAVDRVSRGCSGIVTIEEGQRGTVTIEVVADDVSGPACDELEF